MDIYPALRGHFKRRTPGNGLRPSTRAKDYLCFGGLRAWHIQSTADTDKSPYMPLISQVAWDHGCIT